MMRSPNDNKKDMVEWNDVISTLPIKKKALAENFLV